jgi:phage terminase small subunit
MRTKPRKPTYLKILDPRSNQRKPRLSDEPQPGGDLGKPPPELSDDAKGEWERVSRQAVWLTSLDRGIFANYCQCWGRWQAVQRTIRAMVRDGEATDGGLLLKNGRPNPVVAVGDRSLAMALRLGTELGLRQRR